MDPADRIDLDFLSTLLRRPAWHRDAACREYPEVDFFPGRGKSAAPARAVCARCLVRDECRTYAFTNNERYGVWGGLSELERRDTDKPSAA